jgi:hypothetical protein
MSRRRILKQVGIGLVGAAGLAAVGQGQASAGGYYCPVCYYNPCQCPPQNGGGKPKKDKKNKKNKNKGNNGFGNGGNDGSPNGKTDVDR